VFALLAIALGLGLAIGAALGGTPRALADVRLRATPLLAAALVAGLAPLAIEIAAEPRRWIQTATNLGVLIFLAVNARVLRGNLRAGLALISLGWALNFLVIAANKGMPLSLWAWKHSGQTGAPTPGEGGFFKIVLAGPDTILRPLGDMIPLHALNQVVSLGDIILLAGIAALIAAGMRSAPCEMPAESGSAEAVAAHERR